MFKVYLSRNEREREMQNGIVERKQTSSYTKNERERERNKQTNNERKRKKQRERERERENEQSTRGF